MLGSGDGINNRMTGLASFKGFMFARNWYRYGTED